jgi:ATP-dependent RNA helicase DDX10/DBP4
VVQAFVSYLRSIYLQKDKSVFKLDQLPLEEFAESLGLPGAPRVKFLSKELAKQKKNASRELQKVLEQEEVSKGTSEEDSGEEAEQPKKTKTSVSGGLAICYHISEQFLGNQNEIRPHVRAKEPKARALP